MRSRLLFLFLVFALCRTASAIDFFFDPPSVSGNVGETVVLSGQIGASDLMRGFTVYMAYDTNAVDLTAPAVAGALIVNREGLQFNCFDHPPFEPNVLEVGGTIFGTDFWQGPGELFRITFTLRSCGVQPIAAPFAPFFVAADESYPPVTYHAATVIVCPGTPASPIALTIAAITSSSLRLQWPPVMQNIAGQPLAVPPVYLIYRQQIHPLILPVENIATVPDTSYIDNSPSGTECLYYISAQVSP